MGSNPIAPVLNKRKKGNNNNETKMSKTNEI